MKCCQNGELSDRRRTLSAMRYPHPLRHKRTTSFMEGDTRSGRRSGLCCVFLPVCVSVMTPLVRMHEGLLF